VQTRFAPTVRARDEDRVHACAAIDAAFADGQLAQDEYDLRIALAKDAATLADLHDLIDDLQGETDLAPVPTSIVGARPSARATVVRWLVLLGVAGAVFFLARACATDDSATGQFGSGGYLTPSGLNAVVASVPAAAATTVVDELGVYPTYALLHVADPANPRREQNYYYRDGEWERRDDEDRAVTTASFDLAELRPGVAGGLVLGAGRSLNIASVDSMYVYFRADASGAAIDLYAANDSANQKGNLSATLDGDFIRVSPFDPAK
jgi:hypothetical protein